MNIDNIISIESENAKSENKTRTRIRFADGSQVIVLETPNQILQLCKITLTSISDKGGYTGSFHSEEGATT